MKARCPHGAPWHAICPSCEPPAEAERIRTDLLWCPSPGVVNGERTSGLVGPVPALVGSEPVTVYRFANGAIITGAAFFDQWHWN